MKINKKARVAYKSFLYPLISRYPEQIHAGYKDDSGLICTISFEKDLVIQIYDDLLRLESGLPIYYNDILSVDGGDLAALMGMQKENGPKVVCLTINTTRAEYEVCSEISISLPFLSFLYRVCSCC